MEDGNLLANLSADNISAIDSRIRSRQLRVLASNLTKSSSSKNGFFSKTTEELEGWFKNVSTRDPSIIPTTTVSQ
ncbi:Hypothetical predicted protein, partial [Paramuricea clavata]